MLTVEEAKKIGIRACVEKIGYDFCKAHPDNGVSAYGEEREGEDAEREAAAWAAEHASSRSFYALHCYLCSGTSIP